MYVYESKNGHATTAQKSVLERYFGQHQADHPIVVHFHGALNNSEDAASLASALTPAYQTAGGHPLFFSWNSDILTAIWSGIFNKLDSLNNDDSFLSLLGAVKEILNKPNTKRLLMNARFSRAGALSIAREPGEACGADRGHVSALRDRIYLPEPSARVAAKIRMELPENVQYISGGADALLPLVWRVIYRVAREDRSDGIIILEEVLRALFVGDIGSSFWNTLKDGIRKSFNDNGAGSYFLKKLAAYVQAKPDQNIRVVLIGHSAGTIYISHLIDAASRILPSSVKFEVVFQAAAVSFEDFDRLVLRHKTRIRGIRVFGLHVKEETKDHAHELYPHSILYLVSALLEDQVDKPLMGMAYYYRRHKYYHGVVREVREYLQPYKVKRVWSPRRAENGLSSNATRHKGFSEEPQTIESVKWIIQNGLR